MSEPIQSISQGNYILHNIDAKKLYVQEPLFTANSGDAVYVGWRPDETVLYSATANPTMVIKNQVSSYNLSEPITNFDRIRLNFVHSYGFGTYQFCNSVDVIVDPFHNGQDGTADVWKLGGTAGGLYDANNFTLAGTTLTVSGDGRYKISANGTVFADLTARGAALQSVIGINRKENA